MRRTAAACLWWLMRTAGVDCFEHTGLATAPEYPPDIIALIRERTAQSSLGPLFWTPTIEGLFNYEYTRDHPEKLDDLSWHAGLTPEIIADIRTSIAHPERLAYFQVTPARRPTLERKFRQLRESGAMLLIGTDSGIPMKFHSQSTWNELDVWVRLLGVAPMDAYWPVVAMKVDKDYGTVAEGKYADIIAVKGDAVGQAILSPANRHCLQMKLAAGQATRSPAPPNPHAHRPIGSTTVEGEDCPATRTTSG